MIISSDRVTDWRTFCLLTFKDCLPFNTCFFFPPPVVFGASHFMQGSSVWATGFCIVVPDCLHTRADARVQYDLYLSNPWCHGLDWFLISSVFRWLKKEEKVIRIWRQQKQSSIEVKASPFFLLSLDFSACAYASALMPFSTLFPLLSGLVRFDWKQTTSILVCRN